METGVNHLDFISSYSPIGDDEHGHHSAKPEYYGMLAFSLAGKGQLLAVESDANSSGIKAYATQSNNGALAFTLINKGSETPVISVNLGEHTKARQASLIRLSGPAIDAKTGIKLGGAEVTPDGAWKAASTEVLRVKSGQFFITLPAASAAVIHF